MKPLTGQRFIHVASRYIFAVKFVLNYILKFAEKYVTYFASLPYTNGIIIEHKMIK